MKNYRIQKNGVTHDNFDDEIVALNLVEGKYYNMEDTASFIWQCLHISAQTNAIVDQLSGLHEGNTQALLTEVQAFLDMLETEGLIYESPDLDESVQLTKVKLPERYTKPVLNVFTDMQEVIALDPVHDVSEKGWPHKKS